MAPKTYLRFEPTASFGAITSGKAGICADRSGSLLIAPAVDAAIVWNPRLGKIVRRLAISSVPVGEVSSLALSPDGSVLAVGLDNGRIELFSFLSAERLATLVGHRSAVGALAFDRSGTLLASGSKDTVAIVWDVSAHSVLHRMAGHVDAVTCIAFVHVGERATFLITGSKDHLLKIWEIETVFCMQTLVEFRNEVWSLAVDPSEKLLVAGGTDADLQVFDVEQLRAEEPSNDEFPVKLLGPLPRKGKDRVHEVLFSPDGSCLFVHDGGKTVEVFRVSTDEKDVKRKLKRRQKRLELTDLAVGALDYCTSERLLHLGSKIRGICYMKQTTEPAAAPPGSGSRKRKEKAAADAGATVAIGVSFIDNAVEVHHIHLGEAAPETSSSGSEPVCRIDQLGHRSDIRCSFLSSEDAILATCSAESLKLWNVPSGQCVLTAACGYALCCCFAPGNRYVFVGTKEGNIEVFDCRSSTMVDSVSAHVGAVWSMCLLGDGSGLVSGGADKSVRIWDFGVAPQTRHITLKEARSLEMQEDVLCVKVTADRKLLLVSTLDSVVRAFYFDSLKFFVAMYGHKLPVVSMDVSDDSTLLVTGSSDKNVKIWGLDFGDCHKSIFAHDDSVMQVCFQPRTHYFMSAGKDGTVKYWDADHFEMIHVVARGISEVWALSMASDGMFMAAAGHDRAIRVFSRSEDIVYLEEERERERDMQVDADLERDSRGLGAAGNGSITSREAARAADRLAEAVEAAVAEQVRLQEHEEELSLLRSRNAPLTDLPKFERDPRLLDRSPVDFLLLVVFQIPESEIESAVLLLPFGLAMHLSAFLGQACNAGKRVHQCVRILLLILRTHYAYLTSSAASAEVFPILQRGQFEQLLASIRAEREIVGFNLAAMKHLRRQLDSTNHHSNFRESSSS